MKNKVKMMMVGTTAVGALLAASPAANALQSTGTLVTLTPISTSPDSVNGSCTGTPAGGSFDSTNFVVQATANASSTAGDVGLATGVTCRVWDAAHSVWLSDPVSASDPGPDAVAAGEVSVVTALTDPIPCVYTNALFTGNHTASNRSGSPCPSHP